MERIRIRPAPGLLVRDPFTHRQLPPDGDVVNRTTYWERRLMDGDVELISVLTSPAEE